MGTGIQKQFCLFDLVFNLFGCDIYDLCQNYQIDYRDHAAESTPKPPFYAHLRRCQIDADDSVPEKDRRKDDAPKRAEDQIKIGVRQKAICQYSVADERGNKREGENEEGDRAVIAYF